MQIEKKPFGVVRIIYYFINVLLFLMLTVYLFDFGLKYFQILNYLSPILLQYYSAMFPVDMLALVFDVLIVYFLFSARKVIADRVLGGAAKLNSAILSVFFMYFLKFIFLNMYIYFKLIPLVSNIHFFLLYKVFLTRLIIFFVLYLFYAMFMEYSKSVKWYFGHNYKGLYNLQDSFYYPIKKYLLFLGKSLLVVCSFFIFLFLPISLISIKLVISSLSGISLFYLLFLRKI